MNSPVEERKGISAVTMASDALAGPVLDLAAVLQGLVSANFEIIVVGESSPRLGEALAGLRATAPGLPLRRIEGKSIADGCDAAIYDLVFVCAPDGQFDVRELNHLLEAVEAGADIAIGYRPRRTDRLVRQLQRLGWQIDVDCAFGLFRRSICNELRRYSSSSGLLWRVRHLGRPVAEMPVLNRRPTIGTPAPAESRAA
jgi:hypothetical protein